MSIPGVTFYLRGDALNARFAKGDNRAALGTQASGPSPSGVVAPTADAGAIGGQTITMRGGLSLIYSGRENTPATQSFSVIARVKIFSANGNVGMWGFGAFGNIGAPNVSSGIFNLGFRTRAVTAFGFTPINNEDIVYATNPPDVTGASYNDIVWTYTRASGANAMRMWVNNVLISGGYTAGNNFELPINPLAWSAINIGVNSVFNSADQWINEFAIVEGIVDPSSISLESGVGALTGSSRTSFLDIPAFSGITWPVVASTLTTQAWNEYGTERVGTATIPAAGNVRLGTVYGTSGTGSTGTVVVPSTSNTKIGVAVDVSGTGTYDGSDRWTDPGLANVKNAISYKANSTSNNMSGTLVSTDPGVANVLDGVAYTIESVGKSGIFVTPAYTNLPEDQVKIAVPYTANNISKTGTYDGSDRWTTPVENNVLDGIAYKNNSTINNQVGNVILPGTNEVERGVEFGSNGDLTGTFIGEGFGPNPTGPAPLPNMSNTLNSWFKKMTFTVVEKIVINFQIIEEGTEYNFMGVWQPFTSQQLMMKTEGQRSWKWFKVHAQTKLILAPDMVIEYSDAQYRVMSKSDYKEYGYVEYDLVEDFTGAGPEIVS